MSDQPTKEQLKEQMIQDIVGFNARSAGIDKKYPTIKQMGGHYYSEESPEERVKRACTHAIRYFMWLRLFEDAQEKAAPFSPRSRGQGLEEQLKELRDLRDLARQKKVQSWQSLERLDGLKGIAESQMSKLEKGSQVRDSDPYFYSLAWALVLDTLEKKKD